MGEAALFMNDQQLRRLRALAFPTAVGWYGVAYSDDAISFILGPQAGPEEAYERLQQAVGGVIARDAAPDGLGRRAADLLIAYHNGDRVEFDLPLEWPRVTAFTRDVLLATARIPYGEVRSYAWVARESGHPKAMRAVGNALHVNPWAPIIPCHRVVSSNQSLGGFAKGAEMKQWYLRLEGYLS
jgi:methylated-DNA-[protein]-cysteine S-methyltransferase